MFERHSSEEEASRGKLTWNQQKQWCQQRNERPFYITRRFFGEEPREMYQVLDYARWETNERRMRPWWKTSSMNNDPLNASQNNKTQGKKWRLRGPNLEHTYILPKWTFSNYAYQLDVNGECLDVVFIQANRGNRKPFTAVIILASVRFHGNVFRMWHNLVLLTICEFIRRSSFWPSTSVHFRSCNSNKKYKHTRPRFEFELIVVPFRGTCE